MNTFKSISFFRFFNQSKWLASLFTALILAGCASNRLSHAERNALYEKFVAEEKLEELSRITAFRLDGWRYLSNDYIIVSTGFNRPYLLKISGPCNELAFSHTLGINRDGSSLNAKFDSVFVPEYPMIKCFIRSIHKLTRDQADQLSAMGKKQEEHSESQLTEEKT